MAKPKYGMPRGKLKNLTINELSGVDKPCQQPALVALMKRHVAAPAIVSKALFERVLKQAVLTSSDAGHAHSIDLCDPACEWRDSYSTSSQTAAGAEYPHSHAWTFDQNGGAITIADDSGHSHKITAVVPADVLTAAVLNAAAEQQRRARANAINAAEAAATGAVAVTVAPVAMRAPPAPISTPAQPVPTVKGNSQENRPMDAKVIKLLATALLLPEAQRQHVAKLATGEDVPGVQAFLALDSAGREDATNAALAADPVVYTTKGGAKIRKSHGELAKQQAEQIDRQAEQIESQNTAIAVAKARADQAEVEKRAAELIPLIGKSAAVRVAILKGASALADEALRNEVIEALKGANEAFKMLGVPHGTTQGGEPVANGPVEKFNAELATFAKSKNKSPMAATADFIRTQEGADLYAVAYPRTQA